MLCAVLACGQQRNAAVVTLELRGAVVVTNLSLEQWDFSSLF
jgi:hypothetical protein